LDWVAHLVTNPARSSHPVQFLANPVRLFGHLENRCGSHRIPRVGSVTTNVANRAGLVIFVAASATMEVLLELTFLASRGRVVVGIFQVEVQSLAGQFGTNCVLTEHRNVTTVA